MASARKGETNTSVGGWKGREMSGFVGLPVAWSRLSKVILFYARSTNVRLILMKLKGSQRHIASGR